MSVAPDTTVALQDRFFRELPEMAVRWQAEPAPDAQLLVLNEPLAAQLGLDADWLRSPASLRFLVGNLVPDGATPVAQAYAGHQFGGYVPRLGDGRALLLGELIDVDGRVRDIHLKGSGPTPFARGGDGLAVVGPMLREYIVSEAMHALGVPTTRSLAVVGTGRPAQRETLLPSAVLAYDPDAVFSSIDFWGRYAYGNQPVIAGWNLARFAETLLPLLSDNLEEAIALAEESFGVFQPRYDAAWTAGMRAKLGLSADVEAEIITQLIDEFAPPAGGEPRRLHVVLPPPQPGGARRRRIRARSVHRPCRLLTTGCRAGNPWVRTPN